MYRKKQFYYEAGGNVCPMDYEDNKQTKLKKKNFHKISRLRRDWRDDRWNKSRRISKSPMNLYSQEKKHQVVLPIESVNKIWLSLTNDWNVESTICKDKNKQLFVELIYPRIKGKALYFVIVIL